VTSDASNQGGANNGRIACVDVVALPLQLLWHRHPDWKDEPMAVVDRDEPNGTIEWANKIARRQQVRPGMRYAEAVSLCRSLRAGTVKDEEVDQATDHLEEVLRDWSPFVEPADERTGIFWLDAAGMHKLYDSMQAWAEGLADALLEKESFYVSVVVGFTRFGTWAAARASRGQTVFESPADERKTARKVPLHRLNLATSICRDLEKLGVERLGEFLELPPGGLRRRFGPQVLELHRRARGDLQMPLQGSPDEGPIERRIDLEEPAAVTSRLVFAIKRALNPILAELADRETRIARIDVALHGPDRQVESDEPDRLDQMAIQPATPTVDVGRLIELIRLRLEDRDLGAGISAVELRVQTARHRAGQIQLFGEAPSRDLADANRALERLRAEFGPEAVVRAVPTAGHLPEATYKWQPMERVVRPEPPDKSTSAGPPALVRRIFEHPRSLSAQGPPEAGGSGPQRGSTILNGPFVVSGGWWAQRVRRDYVFVERDQGELVWAFYDYRRRRWFLHGRVE
jgi:protein ImuB